MLGKRNEWIDQRVYNNYRYCIGESYTERVLEHKTTHRLIKKWLFEYNDGTFETLIMTEVFKK